MRKHVMLPTIQQHPYFIFPESVGWYWDMPQHTVYRPEGATSFSIHFLAAGKGYVELNNEVFTLHQGDAFLYFPEQPQTYYSSQDDPWDVRWVHFYGHKLKDLLVEQGFHRNLWTLKQWKGLLQCYGELLEEAENNGILQRNRLSALTYSILVEFMSYATPLAANRGTDTTEQIINLLPIMQASAAEPFELDYWAEQAGVTPHYFCKLFRKATGIKPMDFITMCRIQNAKQLLIENSRLQVQEIARQVGYPSISYFNQRFMQFEGVTPGQYRKKFNGL